MKGDEYGRGLSIDEVSKIREASQSNVTVASTRAIAPKSFRFNIAVENFLKIPIASVPYRD